MGHRAGLGVAIAGALLAAAGLSRADEGVIYRWTDENGVVRYTPERGRVPFSARDSMVVVEPVRPEAETNGTPGVPATPGALPAVMGRKLPEELVTPNAEPPAIDPAEVDARIQVLREAVAADKQRLQELVRNRGGDESPEIAEERDGQIREIANRLPGLQEELARLERLRGGEPVGPEP